MKPAIAVGMLMLSAGLFIQPAVAGEGRVSEATPSALEQGRVATYTRTAPEPAASSTKSTKTHTNSKAMAGKPQTKSTRPAIAAATSSRAEHFYIYDAGSSL